MKFSREGFMKFLVSHQGHESGPFTLDEIIAKVKAKELELFDYIFDEAKQDWVLLMEHQALASALKSNKPPRPPALAGTGTTKADETSVVVKSEAVAPAAEVHAAGEWYVLKGENKFGPFSYPDIVKMLQQKVVFPFDFIWHTTMTGWKRVAEVGEFTEEKVREFYANKKSGEAKDVFVARKTGEGFEISKGGVGLTMKNALVIPGQQVHVHFTGEGGLPPFNAVCEVVSKKFVNDRSPIQYGLRFVSMTQEVQEAFYKQVA
jgi:hypothetical protein